MPVDSISVQNNDVYLTNANQDGIQWTPNDGVQQSGTDYGTIQSVTIDDNAVTVQTSQGTLTFSGPELDEAKQDFSAYDISETTGRLSDAVPNASAMMFEFMVLMMQMDLEMAHAEHQAQSADRKEVLTEAKEAVKELMSHALANLILGCVGGGLSILGGLASGIGQMKGIGALAEDTEDIGTAKLDSQAAETQQQLSETNVQIAETKQQMADLDGEIEQNPDGEPTDEQATQKQELQAKLDKLEERSEQLSEQRSNQLSKVGKEIDETTTELDKVKTEEARLTEENEENPSAKTQKKLDAVEHRRERLESRLQSLNQTQTRMEAFGEPAAPDEIEPGDLASLQDDAQQASNWNAQSKLEMKEAWGKFNTDLQHMQINAGKWNAIMQFMQGAGGIGSQVGAYEQTVGQGDHDIKMAQSSQAESLEDEAKTDKGRNLDDAQKFMDVWQSATEDTIQALGHVFA